MGRRNSEANKISFKPDVQTVLVEEPVEAATLPLTLSGNLKSFALLWRGEKWRSLTLLLPITFGAWLLGGVNSGL